MNSGLLFIATTLIVAIVAILWAYKSPSNAIRYFKTSEGKKVLKGILAFIAFGVILVLATACNPAHADWFEYGEVYIGLDRTNEVSPQCLQDGPDDKMTSNGGIRANVYQSDDKRFSLNGKYTHHSCAFNPDRNTYDGAGIEIVYRLW